jgi:hypothetical protein
MGALSLLFTPPLPVAEYTPYPVGKNYIFLSEGCQYIGDQANAYWLFTLIQEAQQEYLVVRGVFVQFWKLQRECTGEWSLSCRTIDGNQIWEGRMAHSDFPLSNLGFIYTDGRCLLESEYYLRPYE